MKTKILLVTVTAMALLIGVSAFAQRGPGGPGGPGRPGGRGELNGPRGAEGVRPDSGDPFAAVQAALGLSAAQIEAAKALLTRQRAEIQPIQAEIRAKQQALRTLQQSGTASAADLGTALSAVQAAQARLDAIHDKFIADFDNLLTSDQRQLLADTRAAAERIPALARLGLIGGGPGGRGRK